MTNAKVEKFEGGKAHVLELNEDGSEKKRHELPFKYSMMLPAFRGIPAVRGIEGLVNPRGFVIVDKHQRNPKYPNIYGVGVCIAIPPYEPTPVPVGVPKTGYMIESMVTATAHNIRDAVAGKEPSHEATWNAICLADFGDTGVAFIAQPQNPPRNVNWSAQGKWVHLAKIAFEKYFMGKVQARHHRALLREGGHAVSFDGQAENRQSRAPKTVPAGSSRRRRRERPPGPRRPAKCYIRTDICSSRPVLRQARPLFSWRCWIIVQCVGDALARREPSPDRAATASGRLN